MARASYRHLSPDVIQIVRPTRWSRVAPRTRAILTGLGCLLGCAGAAALYVVVGLPFLALTAIASFAALLWHGGRSAREPARSTTPTPPPRGGERQRAS
jgi:hypothetical protein